MSAPSSLLLVAPDGPSSVPPETELLGLPIVRRTALTARRAGFSRVAVAGVTPGSPLARALDGIDVERLAAGAPAPEGAVVLPWNRVLRTSEVRRIASGHPAADLGVPVGSPADLPRAERWLLRSLIRDTEGFMSRRFERPVSLAVSRRLAHTSVTPNQMTLVSVAIGFFGALFFLSERPALQTLGALAFLLHSILDGCDGELARLKLLESRFGGILDFWGDNVVHAAIFGCMAIGWSRAAGAAWPLWLGAAAVAGTFASAGFVYWSTMRGVREGPLFVSVTNEVDGAVSRVADLLGRRDFIYLVIALSLFGKANWFLVAAAAGAPIFFVVLLSLEWRRSRRKAS
ncbi:MAG TPA: CDP-alcohol phosphatidyltransferase family protein [Thermoanaerobaculia bacterium]|jgi:phosphatidylglycerophosphate synthase